ncbi:hypothetical protein [Sphingobacterium lactis]|uniref:Uncharacterized protein n=1 Tax=Sphingobacterium lactis TaxID=797291 RepID=A0A1H6CSI2_9SPHI|nr:hypothetical protein [Sphingobacterium lactis]SEG75934.1 hypothetical protein SAMN05421877_11956 [Sphingobacterium lactis]
MSKLSVNLSFEVLNVEIIANVKVCDEIKQINIATMSYEDFEKNFCYDDGDEIKEKKSLKELVDDKVSKQSVVEFKAQSSPINLDMVKDRSARIQ